MGVFGQERGEISAFLYGKKCGKKCGGNAEKMRMEVFGLERGEISAFLYGKKCGGNAEKMRMGVFGQEYGEISALYPHFSHNVENISAFPILRIQAIMRRITWRIMRRWTEGRTR